MLAVTVVLSHPAHRPSRNDSAHLAVLLFAGADAAALTFNLLLMYVCPAPRISRLSPCFPLSAAASAGAAALAFNVLVYASLFR